MDIDITTLTRAPGEDPNDDSYIVTETTVGGFSMGDRVRVVDKRGFSGDYINETFTIQGFMVIEGEVCASFTNVSKTGLADQSAPVENLVFWHSQVH